MMAHVRDTYIKDGVELPAKDGLAMDTAAFKMLQQSASRVTDELGKTEV